LTSKYINDFEKFYEQYSKSKNKWLSSCIQTGKQLFDGELDVMDLVNINDALIRNRQRSKSQKNDCYKAVNEQLINLKLCLEKQINSDIKLNPQKSKDELEKYQSSIIRFIRGIAQQESSIGGLCDCLYELSKFDISYQSPIEKLVKLLINVCVHSSCSKLKEVAFLAQKLRDFWNSKSEENNTLEKKSEWPYVYDKKLRKNVCWKIFKVLEQKDFDTQTAQELAITIEENLRKKDPSMSGYYRNLFRKMIRDIKYLSPVVYRIVRNEVA